MNTLLRTSTIGLACLVAFTYTPVARAGYSLKPVTKVAVQNPLNTPSQSAIAHACRNIQDQRVQDLCTINKSIEKEMNKTVQARNQHCAKRALNPLLITKCKHEIFGVPVDHKMQTVPSWVTATTYVATIAKFPLVSVGLITAGTINGVGGAITQRRYYNKIEKLENERKEIRNDLARLISEDKAKELAHKQAQEKLECINKGYIWVESQDYIINTIARLGRCEKIKTGKLMKTREQIDCEKQGKEWAVNPQFGLADKKEYICVGNATVVDPNSGRTNNTQTPINRKATAQTPISGTATTQTPIASQLEQMNSGQESNTPSTETQNNKENSKTQHEIMMEYLKKTIEQAETENKKFEQLIQNDIATAQEFIKIQNEINAIKFEMLRLQHQSGQNIQEEYNRMAKTLANINSQLDRRNRSNRIINRGKAQF